MSNALTPAERIAKAIDLMTNLTDKMEANEIDHVNVDVAVSFGALSALIAIGELLTPTEPVGGEIGPSNRAIALKAAALSVSGRPQMSYTSDAVIAMADNFLAWLDQPKTNNNERPTP